MKKCNLILIIIYMIYACVFNTFAYTVTEHCFSMKTTSNITYNDHTGSWYIKPVDTTYWAYQIHNVIDTHGYYQNGYFVNNSNLPTATSIGIDGIFYISEHGDAGQVICPYYDSAAKKYKVNLLTATNTYNDPLALSLQQKYGSTTDKLKKVRLAFFNSCHSGSTASTSDGYGNLLYTSVNLGADCAVGYIGEIDDWNAGYMAYRTICYYGMDSNNTVSACLASAIYDTFEAFVGTNGYGGVDSCVYVGDGNTILAPASYGIY